MIPAANNLIENRQIRVFISSTFRDMQAERDYLMTRVFPLLRRKAARRDVSLVELDLRWGITEEESKSGRVVQICLNEIDNSRPFFIGLLGDRYGWCPDRRELGKDTLLEERYPWLEEELQRGVSITEIEMQYGVLRSPEPVNAYFFLKKGSDESDERLRRLKDAIRNHPRYPHAEYGDPEQLGRQVEAAFDELLDRLFPQDELSPLEAERLAQRAFLRSRCGTYVRNEKDFEALDTFLHDDRRQLFVTGQSGMGKSALIANWIDGIGKNPARNIIYHFVGNSGAEGDYRRILGRLNAEIRDLYAIENDGHGDRNPEKSFQELLAEAGSRKPLLLVLDGIDQLADERNAKLLNWLPEAPAGVKILLSTREDDATASVLRRRGYPDHPVRPLDEAQRRKLIDDHLRQYGKSLTPGQTDRIVTASVMRNTLVLRTLLDELVSFGIHEQLDRRIDRYLDAANPDEFFQRVLLRAEEDYGAQLVRDTLALIALSRAGLSEPELLGISGIRQLEWSQFYCAFAGHFTVKNGLVQFSHRYLRNAVRSKYLSREADIRACRERIIAYMTDDNPLGHSEQGRIYDELAHQYHEAGMTGEMYALLTDYDAFNYYNAKDQEMLGRYWRTLLETGRYSPEAYLNTALPEEDELRARFLFSVDDLIRSELTEYRGNYPEFIRRAVEIGRKAATRNPEFEAELVDAMTALGEAHRAAGELESSKATLGEALGIARRLAAEDPQAHAPKLYKLLDSMGWTLEENEEFEQAEAMYREAIRTAREMTAGSDKGLQAASATMSNLAVLCMKTERIDLAEQLIREALVTLEATVKRGPRYKGFIAQYLSNLANLHWEEMGRFEEAEQEYNEALNMWRQLVAANPAARYSLLETLENSGLMYREMERHDLSQRRYEEILTIERELAKIAPDPAPMVDALFELGLTHTMRQQFDEALRCYDEALALVRQEDGSYPGDNIDLLTTIAKTLQNRASLYYNRRDFEAAVASDAQAVDILRGLRRDKAPIPDLGEVLVMSLNHSIGYRMALADTYYEAREYTSAANGYIEVLELCEELENEYDEYDDQADQKLVALNRLGIILSYAENYGEAENMFLAAFDLAMALYQSDEDTYYGQLKSACDNLIVLYTRTGRPELAEGFRI